MPRPVVPSLLAPRAASRALSIAPCIGRIRVAFSASSRVSGVIVTPFSLIFSISGSSAQGSTTTPLPITDSLPSRTTPDGSSDRLYSTLPMTSVWPALWPPWKRTTTSARLDSQSTIFPLPSSPHWTPTTTTFAIALSLLNRNQSWPNLKLDGFGRTRLQNIAASQPFGFRLWIGRGAKAGDGDPAGLAQYLGV